MIKTMSIVFSFLLFAFYVNAQANEDNKLNINSGNQSNVLIYFNGSIFKNSLYNINPDTIGAIFAEGDSSYVKRSNGTNPDTSLIYHYYGKLRNRGILFIYTKNKVETITQKESLQYLKNKKYKILFKINKEPLTDIYHKVDADKIQIIKDFTLTHWDTGITDTFALFVIETKN